MLASDRLVGWYKTDQGKSLLLTYGPDKDYRIMDLGQPGFSQRITRMTDTVYRWIRPDETVTVGVESGPDGPAALTWTMENSEKGRAERITQSPYLPIALSWQNGAVTLSGTLFQALDGPGGPLAVMVHGSGSSNRDNLWYMRIADFLLRQGVHILLPDKRGCGQSDGEWRTAAFDDFAGDVLAGIRAARDSAHITPRVSGLIGISQGGRIAPLAAYMAPEDVDFVIALSSAAVTPNQQLKHETIQTFRQSGLPGWLAKLLAPVGVMVPRLRRSAWWRKNGSFDPIPYWSSLTIPRWVVLGSDDEEDNVPVRESVRRFRAAGAGQGNSFKITVYPDSGHGLFEPGTRRIRKDFFKDLQDWVASALR